MYRHAFALVCASALLLSAGSARADDSGLLGDDGILGSLYTSWELLYVERDKTPDVEMGYMFTPGHPRFRDILTTDELVDDDQHFGGRGVIGLNLNETQSVELVYMGWGHDSEASARSPLGRLNAFEAPDASPADNSFDDAERFDADYDEDFYNAELNYRHRLEVDGADYHFTLLAGMRVIHMEEDLRFFSFDEVPLGNFGSYNLSTTNTLIGGQIGVETHVPLHDRVDLDLYAAMGGYANKARASVEFFNNNPLVSTSQSRVKWDPAGVFEFATNTSIKVVDGVTFKFGYRALILNNIASTPDQFARSGSGGDFITNYDNDDTTIFHGPHLGFQLDF